MEYQMNSYEDTRYISVWVV